MVTISVN